MSSLRPGWFDVKDEDEDEKEKLEINGKMLKFKKKKHAEIAVNVHLYTSQSLLQILRSCTTIATIKAVISSNCGN